MTGREIVEQIKAQRSADHCCVKSWRNDHKFVDFEFVDRFIEQVKTADTFEGFELLSLDQMWEALTSLDPDNLLRVRRGNNELIEWVWTDKDGRQMKNTYPFSPEGIMTIMNDELFA